MLDTLCEAECDQGFTAEASLDALNSTRGGGDVGEMPEGRRYQAGMKRGITAMRSHVNCSSVESGGGEGEKERERELRLK